MELRSRSRAMNRWSIHNTTIVWQSLSLMGFLVAELSSIEGKGFRHFEIPDSLQLQQPSSFHFPEQKIGGHINWDRWMMQPLMKGLNYFCFLCKCNHRNSKFLPTDEHHLCHLTSSYFFQAEIDSPKILNWSCTDWFRQCPLWKSTSKESSNAESCSWWTRTSQTANSRKECSIRLSCLCCRRTRQFRTVGRLMQTTWLTLLAGNGLWSIHTSRPP